MSQPSFEDRYKELRLRPGEFTAKRHNGVLDVLSYGEYPDLETLHARLVDAHRPDDARKAEDFSLEHSGRYWRGQLYPHMGGYSVILRHIPRDIPALRDLGFEPKKILSLAQQSGLVLFCGPMGAGKSTSMAATMEALRQHERLGETVTLENPIEFYHGHDPLTEQREVGVSVESFSAGIREAMRESKTTIVVGEIRDPETATVAVQAGLSGHLVLATLHADSIQDGVSRMWGFLDDQHDELLASALQGIVAQHLIAPQEPNLPRFLLYETLHFDGVQTRSALRMGPQGLPTLRHAMAEQNRPTFAEHAKELVQGEHVSWTQVKRWIS